MCAARRPPSICARSFAAGESPRRFGASRKVAKKASPRVLLHCRQKPEFFAPGGLVADLFCTASGFPHVETTDVALRIACTRCNHVRSMPLRRLQALLSKFDAPLRFAVGGGWDAPIDPNADAPRARLLAVTAIPTGFRARRCAPAPRTRLRPDGSTRRTGKAISQASGSPHIPEPGA